MHDPKKLYAARKAEALALLDRIRAQLEAHERRTGEVHWGHCGDMGYVVEGLQTVTGFLLVECGAVEGAATMSATCSYCGEPGAANERVMCPTCIKRFDEATTPRCSDETAAKLTAFFSRPKKEGRRVCIVDACPACNGTGVCGSEVCFNCEGQG